jgi:hypothetical protein
LGQEDRLSIFDVSPYGCAFNQTTQHLSQACVDLTNTPFELSCSFGVFGDFSRRIVNTESEKMIEFYA